MDRCPIGALKAQRVDAIGSESHFGRHFYVHDIVYIADVRILARRDASRTLVSVKRPPSLRAPFLHPVFLILPDFIQFPF